MRTALFLAAIACISFFGCKKNEYPNNNNSNNNKDTTYNPVVDSNAMRYIISGITDNTLQWTDSLIMPLAIGYTGGDQENLSLSITGLPEGATADFDVKSGIPSFASILKLRTNSTPGGEYTVKIVSTTQKDSVKTFNMKLTVIGEPLDCAKTMAGKYNNELHSITNNTTSTKETVAEVTTIKQQILLKNVYFDFGASIDMKGILNCEHNSIILEKYAGVNIMGHPFTIDGTGTFTANTISLHFSLQSIGYPPPPQSYYEYDAILTRK